MQFSPRGVRISPDKPPSTDRPYETTARHFASRWRALAITRLVASSHLTHLMALFWAQVLRRVPSAISSSNKALLVLSALEEKVQRASASSSGCCASGSGTGGTCTTSDEEGLHDLVTPGAETSGTEKKSPDRSAWGRDKKILCGAGGDSQTESATDALESAKRRLCTRDGWFELFGFVAWLCVICAHALQLWGIWWFFWQYVANEDSLEATQDANNAVTLAAATGATAARAAAQGGSALAGTLAARAVGRTSAAARAKRAAAFAAWSGWIAGFALVERPLLKRRLMSPPVFAVCYHAELFALSGLAMTICTNFASFVHQPGKPLFDIGFWLVPEIGPKSSLHSVSDAMTGVLPVATFLYVCVFLDRRRRCRAITDWFRMMTVIYCFRCITSTMTSLPGPAPHCSDGAYKRGSYLPPTTWHDIATSLFTAVSGGSCGDLLFSGHAAMTTVTTLLLVRQQRRHGRKAERTAKLIGCTYIAIVCLFALASRKHYTVDLALGTLIGSLTYFRFRDSWTRDPVALDRMDTVARYYASPVDHLAHQLGSDLRGGQDPVLEDKPVSHIV